MNALRGSFVPLAALALLLTGEGRACAKLPVLFDLRSQTEGAELIVHGWLDTKGNLTVDETLKGKAPAERLVLTNGAGVFAALKAIEKRATSVEVVVHLNQAKGKWAIEGGEAGAVGFLGNGVYLVRSQALALNGACLSRHPNLSRDNFQKKARAAVVALERRKTVVGLLPSARRMNQLVSFWLGLESEARWHHGHELSRALCPLSSDEEKAIVTILKSSRIESRMALLELIRRVAKGKVAFEAVAELLDRRQPFAVRRAAIDALGHIDPQLAKRRLLPLLRTDEPELLIVLRVLRWCDPARPDPAVVKSLLDLTASVRRMHRDDREAMSDVSHALIDLLGHHGHPKLLFLLLEWTLSDNHESAERAGLVLNAWTSLSPRDDPRAWARWWKQAKPLLEADYDLRRPDGRRKWFRAYRSADAVTRKILLRSWAFEPTLDEAAMVREAGGEGGDVAKAVLAALWTQGRLSAAAKGAIVEKFVSVRLEEVSGRPVSRARELRIVGEKRFPFPPEAWVEWRAAFAVGEDTGPTIGGSYNVSSLGEKAGPQTLGTRGGGSYPGSPQARAILELREPAASGKPAWTRRWTLKPIRLREVK